MRTQYQRASGELTGDLILSTIPLTALTRLIPDPPADVVEAARGIRFRGMILLYLVLETDQFTEFDAAFDTCDLVLTPTTPTPAFELGDSV